MKYNFPLLIAACVFAGCMSGCAQLGIESPFANDPLTGGINTQTSSLLNIPLPVGLQRYPDHSAIKSAGENGHQGLETLRGYIDQKAAAINFYGNLHAHNWQLRLAQRNGEHAVYVYQKNSQLATLVFYPQGLLTIIEIWAGPRLPDGSALGASDSVADEEPEFSIAGEEYGPLDSSGEKTAPKGKVEQWGTGVRERNI